MCFGLLICVKMMTRLTPQARTLFYLRSSHFTYQSVSAGRGKATTTAAAAAAGVGVVCCLASSLYRGGLYTLQSTVSFLPPLSPSLSPIMLTSYNNNYNIILGLGFRVT